NIMSNLNNPYNCLILGKIYNSNYDNYLIYGFYADTSTSPYYGYIYLVDGDLNEIQMITEFASGTKLFPITALNQGEDNNLYGLSITVNDPNPVSRVLLFNNIFSSGLISGNYEAILRNSYIVPHNYSQNPYRQNRIIKSPDGAVYYIILRDNSNFKDKVIRFTINVGTENEWLEVEVPTYSAVRFDAKLDKSSGEEVLRYYTLSRANPSVYYDYEINGEVVTLKKSITIPYSVSAVSSQVFVKDIDNIYIYALNNSLGLDYIYKVNGNGLKTIYEVQEQQSETGYYLTTITICEINNGVFFFENYIDYPLYKVSIGYIANDDSYTKKLVGTYTRATTVNPVYAYVDYYYKSNYNLINMYAPMYDETPTTKKVSFDYNSINYNGEGYTNVNSLVPNKARLYDNNNKMIFARNLYNKVINANTTISTLNIPNTNLNNIIIYNQSLIGETNYVLMNNQEEITKNIYENLNINFYVTLRMINNNDSNNQIFNQNGSNRINSSVSSVKDYNNAKATKIRINYSDNTTKIVSIEFYPIQNYYYTKFSIYIDKLISSIDFISNDEETIYNTIRPNFIVGKYYTINQSVRIDERIQTQPVLYNNEQLYYNNEEVYY
ncbi:MAG: hypothetical protein IIV48_05905, partial [Clostridium sp.]|nr:hypothetical protein [Clostridium sp.]